MLQLTTVLLVLTFGTLEASQERQSEAKRSSTFGKQACGIGDVNADGVPDFAVADSGRSGRAYKFSARGERCSVWILSGVDGSVLHRVDSPESDDGFGAALEPAGDVDGDGVRDLLVGTNILEPGKRGKVYAVSGATGEIVRVFTASEGEHEFGLKFSGGVDATADGVPDVLVSSVFQEEDESYSAWVSLFSGNDGALVARLDLLSKSGPYDLHVDWCGDIDSNGVPDFFVAGHEEGKPGLQVAYISGGDGAKLGGLSLPFRARLGLLSPARVGNWPRLWARCNAVYMINGTYLLPEKFVSTTTSAGVAVLADLDGDGIEELAIGEQDFTGAIDKVSVVSSETGKAIYVVRPNEYTWRFGSSVTSMEDIDGDGVRELLVGNDAALSGTTGKLWVFSGKTGKRLMAFERDYAHDPVQMIR